MRKYELIYNLTCKYGSEYRTGFTSPGALVNAQIDMLLDSGYCYLVNGDQFWNSDGIDCAIPYICGGDFSWRLKSHDNIVCAVKILYEEVYSEEAIRVEALRLERSKKWSRKRFPKNRILDMQRLKRGEIKFMPVRRIAGPASK